jgi:hypothetical protein
MKLNLLIHYLVQTASLKDRVDRSKERCPSNRRANRIHHWLTG